MWTHTDAQWRHVDEGSVAWGRADRRALHKVKDEETTTSIHDITNYFTVLCPELNLLSHNFSIRTWCITDSLMWTPFFLFFFLKKERLSRSRACARAMSQDIGTVMAPYQSFHQQLSSQSPHDVRVFPSSSQSLQILRCQPDKTLPLHPPQTSPRPATKL